MSDGRRKGGVLGRRTDERRRIPRARRDDDVMMTTTTTTRGLEPWNRSTTNGILVCFGAPRAIVRLGTIRANHPVPPRGVVRCRRAARRSVWSGRSVARARRGRASNPRQTASVPSGGAFGGESALVPRPRGHPTSLSSCRSVPRAGEGPSPSPTLTPPRCPWWPNRTPRTRLARPTRPACSRWWRLEPRSRARVFRPSPRVVATPDLVADASVPRAVLV